MKKYISNLTMVLGILVTGFYGCGSSGNKTSTISREASLDTIKSLEAKLRVTKTPDPALYNRAIIAYQQFADNFPTDSGAPVCLFDAGNVAMSLSQYQRAINYYDTITTKYPSFKRADYCVFLRGYIYDDKLKDTAKARTFYQEVIDKYPKDTALVTQAREAIAILGKSYDEIIKSFEEKNKQQKKS